MAYHCGLLVCFAVLGRDTHRLLLNTRGKPGLAFVQIVSLWIKHLALAVSRQTFMQINFV